MDKDGVLRSIAETGYNVGFGAKKHFATYDIVDKAPGIISFISIAVGIFSLVFDVLATKVPAACLAVAGIMGVYISLYDHRKADYERAGKDLTQVFNDLRALYRRVQAGGDLVVAEADLQQLEATYYKISITKQILTADWYAHYKFFAQMQIDWVNEQKRFTWRDKVPVSFRLFVLMMVIILVTIIVIFGVRLLACRA